MIKVLSPNMLKTFDLCPKKFEFQYIKGILMPTDDSAFTAGKNVHAIASYYLRGANVLKMEKSLSEKENVLWQNLKNSKFFNYKIVATEYPLSVKVGDYFFGGRLDALASNGDTYYILDYKTGQLPTDVKYDYQTMIYLLAVNEFYKTDKITFVYIDVKNQKETTINLTSELRDIYKEKLLQTADKITKSTYNRVNKNDFCHCEYKLICY